MSALTVAIGEINDFLSRHRWRYCLVGGVALSRVGQPRTTEDVDLCLLTGLEHTAEFAGLVLQEFKGRIASPAEFAEINVFCSSKRRITSVSTSRWDGRRLRKG